MRINIYTEELMHPDAPRERAVQIVTAGYISSKTGKPMTNYGVRIFCKSAPELHDSKNDDDRSAVTFWCGPSPDHAMRWIKTVATSAFASFIDLPSEDKP
jgi:hypothetical protein